MTTLTEKDFEFTYASPVAETLEQVKSIIKAHFEIRDWQAVEIIMAAAVAHYSEGEMLWLRLIGPSRSGKTELLRAIATYIGCAEMEVITPAAIRGGFKGAPKLLNRINNKLVITKDFAPLLTSRKDAKNEIFGLLRNVKDGHLVSDFGSTAGHLDQTVKFDWILATTPALEQQRVLESLLGERFIDLRWVPGNREEMAYQAGHNNPYLKEIRKSIAANVCSLLARAAQSDFEPLSDSHIKQISRYADTTAILRTPVQRDRLREIVGFPEPEIATDLTQGLCRIVQGLLTLGIEDYEPYLNRLIWDSMVRNRSVVLKCLVEGDTSAAQIATKTTLAERTVEYVFEDLRLLKVMKTDNQLCMQLHIPQIYKDL